MTTLLSTAHCNFKIIGCTETHLSHKSYVNILNMDGYTLHHKDRPARKGGGVCMYVHSSLHVNVCDDLSINHNETDSLFIEINNKTGKNLIVGVIYRPPESDRPSFVEELDKLLSLINTSNKDCLLLGDYNIDISKNPKSPTVKNNFINTLHSNSFYPTINIPTRVKDTSKTIIDNIITNVHNTTIETGVIVTDISDHFPIFLSANLNQKSQQPHPPVKTRVVNERTLHHLAESIQAKEWDIVYHCRDPDIAYNRLVDQISKSIHTSLPIRSVTRSRMDQTPWLTKGLLNSIKQKNKLYQKYIKNPNLENKNKYTTYRNKLTQLIRKSKTNHYSELIKASKGDSKKSWQVINNVLNRGRKQSVLPDPGNATHADLANELNDYFGSIRENLSRKIIQPKGISFKKYLTGNFPNSFFLKPTNRDETYNIIMTMKPSNSAGKDEISSKILKSIANDIAQPLAHCINLSLLTVIVKKAEGGL